MEKEACEGDEVQPPYRLGQPLVVLGQPPEARRPRKGTLHNPPARQEHEAPLGVGVLDHLKPDAFGLGLGRRLLSRLAPLYVVGQLHALARGLLHRLCQRLYLRALLLGGGCDSQGEQVP